MRALTLEDLDDAKDAFDSCVLSTSDIDHFCSRTEWIIPAFQALTPDPKEPWIWQCEHGFLALCQGRSGHDGASGFSFLQPLESMWGFASPVVTTNAEALARAVGRVLREHERSWRVLLLTGLVPGSPLFRAMVEVLAPRYTLRLGPRTVRMWASLQGGPEAYVASRTANFRRSLKQCRRRAREAGVTFETPQVGPSPLDAEALYQRLLTIEHRSWKGQRGVGIDAGGMRDFYGKMLPRLAIRGGLRVLVARQDTRDVGYILGGVEGTTYRGLQFSFDDELRHIGVGNVAQYEQIVALGAQGVTRYDLGADMEYKRRWADPGLETATLMALCT